MPKKILPRSRPKRDRALAERIASHFKLDLGQVSMILIRGYYLDSMGAPGANDSNVYDDAAVVIGPNIFETYNANTDPSFVKKNGKALAKLNLGLYRFYRGKHKNRYPALRSYPEGVVLDCTRDGKPSTCSAVNIHKGSTNANATDVVWSEGCQTIPDIQYDDWRTRLWAEMDRLKQQVIEVALIENRQTPQGQKLFDHDSRQIN